MSEQDFEDYKSKYRDLYDKVKSSTGKEKVSILEDVDFELELIYRDEINVAYILRLLSNYNAPSPEEKERINKRISEILAGDVELRSKRDLILEFIDKNLPEIADEDRITDESDIFWNKKRKEAFEKLCREENIPPDKVTIIIGEDLFTERKPLPDTIISLLETKPKILERKSIVEKIARKILDYVDIFISGIGES